MDKYSLNGLSISPGEFLSAFFAPDETVCLRIFSDKPDSAFSGQKLEIEHGRFEAIINSLQKHNEQKRGIYFVINHGGHEDADISRINAQFMEMDNITLEEQLDKIKAFPLEPSLIVKTRKSLHCYWLMKNVKKEKFRHIQKGLISYFGADPSCINESRVFRLPGFYHHKEEPILVECIKFNPELRYTQKQLESVLPEIPEEDSHINTPAHRQIKDRGFQKGLVSAGKRCAFLQYCKTHAKTLSEPDWYAMITNLALFEGGEAAIHKLSRPYPKYSHEQTQAKIDHFYKSGTKPMTCAKIAQNGFVCPKMKNGSCYCKAPAGLAFIPLEVNDLKKALVRIKAKHEIASDILLAEQFINDYLYNVSPSVADAFISENVRQHFGFKANNIRALQSSYKEIYRVFASSQEARKAKSGGEVAAWYEINSRGAWKFLPGVLADYLAENEYVIYCGDSYYMYENGWYEARNDKAAQRKVRSFMNTRYALAADIRDAEFQWQILIDKTTREINVNPYLLNFENGIYDLQTDKLMPHDPNIISTIRLGGKYDPTAECPIFLRYLNDVLPATEIPLIQEILGYIMLPITKAQKSFVMVGKPESGKSTLLYVAQDLLLRKDNVSNLTWQDLDEKFATAQLFGKLANIFADLPSKEIRETGTFKAITGEDYISAQHKFKDYFSFKPFCRLMFSCNNVPKNISDRSDGFYRRLIIIRFDHSIPDAKKDGDLKEKLALEKDGIIAWAMVGLKRLMGNKYKFSETDRTRAELAEYKADNSSALAFVNECCVFEPEAVVERKPLYDVYVEYCSENGLKAMSHKRFNAELDGIGNLSRDLDAISRRNIWRGLRLS